MRDITVYVRSAWACESPGKVKPFFMKFLTEIELEKL
jgi:hypothetical protein